MLSGIVISTTKVSEFFVCYEPCPCAEKAGDPAGGHAPYIPTIQEDWRFIKDAMRLRDVSPSLKGLLTHPGMTVECIYVPLMMAASKAADELSIASITRGSRTQNPGPAWCRSAWGRRMWRQFLCFGAFFRGGPLWEGGVWMIELKQVSFTYQGAGA